MHALEPKTQTEDCRNLLSDIHILLEDYAPPWYSHTLRKRLVAALKMLARNDGLEAMNPR